MKVSIGEQSWDWDPDDIEVDEARAIKKATGLSWAPFLAGIFELDPDALRGLVWFLRSKTEPGLPIDLVKFRISDLRVRLDAGDTDDEEPPDPPVVAAAGNRAARRARPTPKTSKAS